MARSLKDGAYRLVGVFQGSKPNAWYRQCIDAAQRCHPDGSYAVSCDCGAWVSNQAGDRTCKHTRVTSQLLRGVPLADRQPLHPSTHPLPIRTVTAMQPLLHGLHGTWHITEARSSVNAVPYRFSMIDLTLPCAPGEQPFIASAFAALAERHAPTMQDVSAAVAAWAGWAIAAEVARWNGFADVGAPPDYHFRVKKSARRPTTDPTAPGGAEVPVGMFDLLEIGTVADLGDGLRPQQRAETCLRLFLSGRYAQLQTQHFLDVSSKVTPGRVYRVRIDPDRRMDKRLRVFDHGRYTKDLCIVRPGANRDIPVADAFLTIFMGLLSDERQVLRVVSSANEFSPFSDGDRAAHLPVNAVSACWVPRHAAPVG